MKKLLTISLLFGISMIVTACGPSEEEKKAAQAENEAMINEKVNEIMEKLEATSAPVNNNATDSIPQDSTTNDTGS